MRGLIRAPLWFIGLLLLAAIGVGVYAYYTTPLPLGLGAFVQTPGGHAASTSPTSTAASGTPGATGREGLTLGSVSVSVNAVQRNQDLTTGNRGGPAGTFTLVDIAILNGGSQPLTPQPGDFRLVDDRGRVYAVDAEATRAINAFAHRRDVFDASVPPALRVDTFLAFEAPPDVGALSLHVALGYGDLVLPR